MTIEEVVTRKVMRRVVYFVFVLYMLFGIDRVNVSFAALRMNQDLGFDATTYGIGISVFFITYLLLQVPSALLIDRLGFRIWLAATLVVWGLPSAGMAFIHDKWSFYVLRLLLGVGEAGFGAGMVYYINSWFPRHSRGTALSLVLMAVPVSVMLGGPLSGWLLSLNYGGFAGWRWLFLAEGLPAILCGVIAAFYVTSAPNEAQWLTADERAWLMNKLSNDSLNVSASGGVSNVRELIRSSRVWAAAGCLFALITGSYGMLFWLPLVIKQISAASDVQVGFISSVPWLAMAIGMYFNARHSDKTQERLWHVGLSMLLCAIGLLMGASLTAPWNLFGLAIAGLGLGGAQGVYWTVPLTFLSGSVVAGGAAMINIIGNSAGLITPLAVGWLRQATGSYLLPTYVLAGALLIGAFLLFLVPYRKPLAAPAPV